MILNEINYMDFSKNNLNKKSSIKRTVKARNYDGLPKFYNNEKKTKKQVKCV